MAANQPISRLEYEIMCMCVVEEPFSIVIASSLLADGHKLEDIESALARLVRDGYLAEVDRLAVNESTLSEYVAKRTAAGEDVWGEWPGVLPEFNFLTTDQGILALEPADRPTLRLDYLENQVEQLKKASKDIKESQRLGVISENRVLLALGITETQLKNLGLK